MSRIGNKPVALAKGVKIAVNGNAVEVVGAKGTLNLNLPPNVKITSDEQSVKIERTSETRQARAYHGLARSLINNMVIGVSQGYKKDLAIIGIGYRAQVQGSKLTMSLGYSHPIEYTIPEGVKVTVAENTKIAVEGCDKHLVGQVAANIRRFRPPEPYKGKGIRYLDEQVTIKEGKSVGK